jgi:hypothetical protein
MQRVAKTLRRIAPALLLAAVAAAAHPHPHGTAPVSPIAAGRGGGAASDIDLFADVATWQDLNFYRLFFFAGGDAGAHSGHIQGGMAAALYPLYLAAFFNGDLFSGTGGTADKDNPSWQGAADQTHSKTVLNDDLVLFAGNDFLGAFRFNLLFNAAEFVSQQEKDGDFYEYRAPFLTSLQWGRRFGGLTTKLTVGAGWGGYESWSDMEAVEETEKAGETAETVMVSTTIQDYTTLGIKLEAAYGNFAADYQISIGLGRSEIISGSNDPAKNGAKKIDVGAVEHLINLYYSAVIPVAEGMALSLRPRLLFGFYNNDYETALAGGGYDKLSSFGFSPMLEAELGWQITEKLFIGTSLSLSALTATFAQTDAASYWEAEGLAVDSDASGALDFRFAFSPSFILEAGLEGLFDFSGARYALDFANLSGGFALIFKPGM